MRIATHVAYCNTEGSGSRTELTLWVCIAIAVPTRRELCDTQAMRLTLKLSLAIGLCILGVLSVHAGLRILSDGKAARSDVRRDHANLSRVLSTGVELLLEHNDTERAQELVSAVSARESNLRIRWLHDGEAGIVPEAWETEGIAYFTVPMGKADAIVTYTPVDWHGQHSLIEVVEELTWEQAHIEGAMVRTLFTMLILLVACLVSLWIFGVLLVGRPIAKVRDHLRRVGEGDLAVRLQPNSKDEIGDLARDVNAMTISLAAEHSRAEEQSAARADTLERLRHADRLRAVGEMASAVAHEVGTPLAIVRARGQQLESGGVSAERTKEIATLIVNEVDRMTKIIRQLLSFARQDASDVQPWHMLEWATETIALIDPLARAAGVRLELSAPELSLEFDSGKLRQVAINLLMNAIQASARGGVVTMKVSVDARGQLMLAVEDMGSGVPEALRAEILEPFFTTKTAGEGTGLGLSVAAGIVRELGGVIRVGDREGGGARFEACIPSHETHSATAPIRPPRERM